MFGYLTHEGDNDWFMVDLSSGSNITLSLETTNRSSGLTTAPVIYMYQSLKGLPVGGVPRITADDSTQTNWPRILRKGAEAVADILFNKSAGISGNSNDSGIYWIRIRSGITNNTGSYSLRISRK